MGRIVQAAEMGPTPVPGSAGAGPPQAQTKQHARKPSLTDVLGCVICTGSGACSAPQQGLREPAGRAPALPSEPRAHAGRATRSAWACPRGSQGLRRCWRTGSRPTEATGQSTGAGRGLASLSDTPGSAQGPTSSAASQQTQHKRPHQPALTARSGPPSPQRCYRAERASASVVQCVCVSAVSWLPTMVWPQSSLCAAYAPGPARYAPTQHFQQHTPTQSKNRRSSQTLQSNPHPRTHLHAHNYCCVTA